ncbi:MAG: hypothetical protein RJQ01_01090 [Microcella sp.]|uniref:hypothetical protein n=1 Tax=Microcella sp. TaxID=1913979 RepID=UPI003315DA98
MYSAYHRTSLNGGGSHVGRARRRTALTYNHTVTQTHELSDSDVGAIFHALADRTRRDIVARVIEREQSVSSLAEG